jgi:hypothetical protein
MKPLELENCLWLKEVGFPQDEEKCPKYVKYDHEPNARTIDEWEDTEFPGSEFLYACPSLEELLEWAKDKLKTVGDIVPALVWSRANQKWEAWADGYGTEEIIDPDPKVAIVKLLRAVLPTKKYGE